MSALLQADEASALLEAAIRGDLPDERRPRVHCLTNAVVLELTALAQPDRAAGAAGSRRAVGVEELDHEDAVPERNPSRWSLCP